MKKIVFILLAVVSIPFYAQKTEDGRHNYTLQGSTFINGTISEEKVKDIFQCSFIYSYRISSFLEFGVGISSGKGQYITLKDYYFAKDEDGIYPFPINGNFIGYNTIKRSFYNYFGRAKLILYERRMSPFFLIDVGRSYMPYHKISSGFNLHGLYFTPSIGYDIQLFRSGKLVLIAGLDKQKIKYETIESYFDVSDPEHPSIIQGNNNRGLKDKFINGLKLSIGFTFNPL